VTSRTRSRSCRALRGSAALASPHRVLDALHHRQSLHPPPVNRSPKPFFLQQQIRHQQMRFTHDNVGRQCLATRCHQVTAIEQPHSAPDSYRRRGDPGQMYHLGYPLPVRLCRPSGLNRPIFTLRKLARQFARNPRRCTLRHHHLKTMRTR